MKSIAYVGLDVHKDDIVGVVLPIGSETPVTNHRITNDKLAVKKWITKWGRLYELRCCYEASSCGYVLQRWLTEMGIECEVIAPSLVPVKPGEKIKTDRRDAVKLARLHRAGELVSVYVPTEEDESVRSLVRCRETMQKEAMKSRHYILKFLSVRGLTYHASGNWSKKHWEYLKGLKFEGADEIVFRQYISLLEYKLSQLEELDRQIAEVAQTDRYKEKVSRLRCLRGIDIHTAMVIVTEIQDFGRFGSPRELMAYLGLVPGEKSSGDTRRLQGITKTGNRRARRVFVEAAWHYQHKPALSQTLKKRQEGQSPEVIAHSLKAQQRLYKKFWGIAMRKERCKAAVAVARELAGFVWALMAGMKKADPQAA